MPAPHAASLRIGLISDTHGLLRPQAVDFLRGCDHIVHAGDVGRPGVLEELNAIAATTAVRGNNDTGEWAERLPEARELRLGEVLIYVLHDLGQLTIDPSARGLDVVVAGHSHKPLVQERDGVLYINPGSAGPRRFKLPVAVGEIVVAGRTITPRIVQLDTAGRGRG